MTDFFGLQIKTSDGNVISLGSSQLVEICEKPSSYAVLERDPLNVKDIRWVNDAWTCAPNSQATNVDGNTLMVYDKNNASKTNYCCPSDWRIDSFNLMELDVTQGSILIQMTVDFSSAKGTDGKANFNCYMTGNYTIRDDNTVTYADAQTTNSEFDFFETGGTQGPGEPPTLFQCTSHGIGDPVGQYVKIHFASSTAILDSGDMSTTASHMYPMTLTYLLTQNSPVHLKIQQTETNTNHTLILPFATQAYQSYQKCILSAGVNNSFIPIPDSNADSGVAGGAGDFGFWKLTDLQFPATLTGTTMAWSGQGSEPVQTISGES